MTTATTAVPGLIPAPTTHRRMVDWVSEVATLTGPDQVVWCDGSPQEWKVLTDQLVAAGTFVRLEKKVNSFWCASDPSDVARVEDRTYICSQDEGDAGPTNNWMDPVDMKVIMTECYRGSMVGRTMYVIPFCMGPLTADKPVLGVQVTDSAYVVASMHIMTRMGDKALALFGDDADFVRCLHSVGVPLKPGEADVPWPCDQTKYITQFPEERMIWSYGSGLHQRRADRRRRHLVGGLLRGTTRAPHHLDEAGLDPRRRRAHLPSQLPLLHSDRAMPHHRPRMGRPPGCADLGDLLRRTPSHHHPPGHRIP